MNRIVERGGAILRTGYSFFPYLNLIVLMNWIGITRDAWTTDRHWILGCVFQRVLDWRRINPWDSASNLVSKI